jgi:hypothetical protein
MAKTRRRTRKVREKTNEAHAAQVEQYIARRGPQPGDETAPTPERMAYAKRAGEKIEPVLERTHKGNPTGRVTWKMRPLVEDMHRRKVLSDSDFNAAWAFMHLCAAYAAKANPKTVQLGVRVDVSGVPMGQAERAVDAQKALVGATRAVHPFVRPMVYFLAGELGDAQNLEQFVAVQYPHTRSLGERARRQEGQVYLRLACGMLAWHFGLSDHSYSHIANRVRKVAEEVCTLEVRKKIAYV